MLLFWCAPLMAEVAWLDWVRLDWRMRYALLDADGDEREVIFSLIKAIHVFFTQSDKDKDRKVLSSLPLLPVRLCVLRPFDPAWLLHVPLLALARAVVPALGSGMMLRIEVGGLCSGARAGGSALGYARDEDTGSGAH